MMSIGDQETIPPLRSTGSLRFVTFNVNGSKTLKNYHPWSSLTSSSMDDLNPCLKYMKGDVITFQELKIQTQDITANIHFIGNLTNYKSFVSIPSSKKGYSGVGVFVRIPEESDSAIVKQALTVVKAEQGITGVLNVPNKGISYKAAELKSPESVIGGYPDPITIGDNIDYKYMQQLDSEGRCVIVELNFNVVIISVYCPANSMCTEDGERFRLAFLRALFQRAKRLKSMGKEVIIMGDINVSVNLIDSDEWLMEGFKGKRLVKPDDNSKMDSDFEKMNRDFVLEFKESSEARKLVNSFLFDTTGLQKDQEELSPFLYDTTREKIGRKMKVYTVWNTFKNNRPLNIGSRIDLILATESLNNCLQGSNIWSFLHGSDHCPVYSDFDIEKYCQALDDEKKEEFQNTHLKLKERKNQFEVRQFYKLQLGKGIDSFFKIRPSKRKLETENEQPVVESENISDSNSQAESQTSSQKSSRSSSIYVSRKKQASIASFFTPTPKINSKNNLVQSDQSLQDQSIKNKSSMADFQNLLSKGSAIIPLCAHNEPCVLRSVKDQNSTNKGKKFWCCARNTKSDSWNQNTSPNAPETEFSCGYFKWAHK